MCRLPVPCIIIMMIRIKTTITTTTKINAPCTLSILSHQSKHTINNNNNRENLVKKKTHMTHKHTHTNIPRKWHV